jgi:hypothetical protein
MLISVLPVINIDVLYLSMLSTYIPHPALASCFLLFLAISCLMVQCGNKEEFCNITDAGAISCCGDTRYGCLYSETFDMDTCCVLPGISGCERDSQCCPTEGQPSGHQRLRAR